jgi:hypothetical protein
MKRLTLIVILALTCIGISLTVSMAIDRSLAEGHERKRFRAFLQTTSRLVEPPPGRCGDKPGLPPVVGLLGWSRGRNFPRSGGRRASALRSRGWFLLWRRFQAYECGRRHNPGTVLWAPGAHLQFHISTTGSRWPLAHHRKRVHQRRQRRRHRQRLCGPSLRAGTGHHQPFHWGRHDFPRPDDRDRLRSMVTAFVRPV